MISPRRTKRHLYFLNDPSALNTIEKVNFEGIMQPLGILDGSMSKEPKQTIDVRESNSLSGPSIQQEVHHVWDV